MPSKAGIILLACVITLCPSTALAHDEELSRAFERCIDESGGITVNMINCIQHEYDRQDARLNVVYKRLMSSLDETQKAKLREAQRAWIKFRDAHGDYLYDPNGGSAAKVNGNSWNMRATADRARELEDEWQRLP